MEIPGKKERLKKRIIVAGLPRSGSTLLWKSIIGDQSAKPSRYKKKSNVLKLHKFDDAYKKKNYKCIFIFGDTIASVISTKRTGKDHYTVKEYLHKNNHFRNCGYEWDCVTEKNLFKEDFLNYEKIFDDWTSNTTYETLCIRYERLYDFISEIEEFIDLKLMLPPKKTRKSDYSFVTDDELKDIKKTYSGLIKKIHDFPDIKYINKGLKADEN